jgi:hypothetical protein
MHQHQQNTQMALNSLMPMSPFGSTMNPMMTGGPTMEALASMAQQFFAAQAAATLAAHPQMFGGQKSANDENESSDNGGEPEVSSPDPSLSPQS